MAYCGQPSLIDYLNFSSSPEAPLKAGICPFVQGGAGMPPELFSLFVFGTVGLALTYRVRHPAPVLVAGLLTGGVAAINAPGMNILGLAVFVGIAALGLYLYQRAKRTF